MYEAFMHNSDFVKSNLIMREDAKGMLEGYHELVNGRNMVFQIAQLFYKNEHAELRVYPVKEHIIQRLQMEPEKLKELAVANLKRFLLMHQDAALKELSRERRVYGRRK